MKRKCKIVGLPDKLPTASQGMNVANGNQNPVIPPTFRGMPSVDSAPEIKVNRSLKPVKREDANLEAEKGETVVTHLSGEGITEFYNIGGKRHYDGGTPLNLPDNSFIFSRDRTMKIKDKEILKDFGKNVGKKGKKSFTPAELSKPYNINKYRQVLADPNSDRIMRESAELMIENYNLKLGKLALVQESQKGFPAGIPQVAMPYLQSIGIPPEELVPPQEPQQPQLPMARYGGVPMYQTPPGETLTRMPTLNPSLLNALNYEAQLQTNFGERPQIKRETFDEAFSRARGAGERDFIWNNKSFTTETAEDIAREIAPQLGDEQLDGALSGLGKNVSANSYSFLDAKDYDEGYDRDANPPHKIPNYGRGVVTPKADLEMLKAMQKIQGDRTGKITQTQYFNLNPPPGVHRYGGSPNSRAIQKMEPSNVSYYNLPKHQTLGETLTPMPILNPLDTEGYQNWYQGQPQVGVVGEKQMYDVAGSSKSKLRVNDPYALASGTLAALTALGQPAVTDEDIANQNMRMDPIATTQGINSTNLGTPYSTPGFGPGAFAKKGGSFKPHMMYDPETGEGFMANKYEDHLRMNDMGYGHDAPKMAQGGERVRFNPASGNYDVVSLGGQVIGTMMAPSMDNGIPEYQQGSETGSPKMWTEEEVELNQGKQKDGDVLKIGDEYYRITNTPIDSKGGKPGDEGMYPKAEENPIADWQGIDKWDGANVITTTSADVNETTDETAEVDETTETKVDKPTTATTTPGAVDETPTDVDMTKDKILEEKLKNNEPITYEDYEYLASKKEGQSKVEGLKDYQDSWSPSDNRFYDEDRTALRGNIMTGLLGRKSGVPSRQFKDVRMMTPTILNPMGARMAELATQKGVYDASMLGGRDAMTYGSKLAGTPSGVIPQYAQMNLQNITGIGNQNIAALNQQAGWEAQARDMFARDVERGRESDNRRLLNTIAQDARLRSAAQGNVRSRSLANAMNPQYNLTGDYRNPIVFDPRYTTDIVANKQQTAEDRFKKATDAYNDLNDMQKQKTTVKDVYNMLFGKPATAGQEYNQSYGNNPYGNPQNMMPQ